MEQEKKYLETLEEVSDALAAGKVVYEENTMGEIKKDKNGFLVYTYKKGGKRSVFNPWFFAGEDKLYIMEPKPLESKPLEYKPLKLKISHLYENKRGEKVLILKRDLSKIEAWLGFNFFIKDLAHFGFEGECFSEWDCDLVKEIADLSKYLEKGAIQ